MNFSLARAFLIVGAAAAMVAAVSASNKASAGPICPQFVTNYCVFNSHHLIFTAETRLRALPRSGIGQWSIRASASSVADKRAAPRRLTHAARGFFLGDRVLAGALLSIGRRSFSRYRTRTRIPPITSTTGTNNIVASRVASF